MVPASNEDEDRLGRLHPPLVFCSLSRPSCETLQENRYVPQSAVRDKHFNKSIRPHIPVCLVTLKSSQGKPMKVESRNKKVQSINMMHT